MVQLQGHKRRVLYALPWLYWLHHRHIAEGRNSRFSWILEA